VKELECRLETFTADIRKRYFDSFLFILLLCCWGSVEKNKNELLKIKFYGAS
jgi:hypothetical protein